MPEVISPHIWYPNGYPGPAYDLRKTLHWAPPTAGADRLNVRFLGDPIAVVSFNGPAFEVAKQASLDAE